MNKKAKVHPLRRRLVNAIALCVIVLVAILAVRSYKRNVTLAESGFPDKLNGLTLIDVPVNTSKQTTVIYSYSQGADANAAMLSLFEQAESSLVESGFMRIIIAIPSGEPDLCSEGPLTPLTATVNVVNCYQFIVLADFGLSQREIEGLLRIPPATLEETAQYLLRVFEDRGPSAGYAYLPPAGTRLTLEYIQELPDMGAA